MEGNKGGLGVQKRRPLKNNISKNKIRKKRKIINFTNIIPDIINFLKSDSYFYSNFISSSASADFSASNDVYPFFRDTSEPILANKDQMKEKLVEYLKSDTYLYTPLEGTQNRDNLEPKAVISPTRAVAGPELQVMRVTSTVLTEKIAWQTKKVAENSVVEKCGDHGSKDIHHDNVSLKFPKTPGLEEVNKKQAARKSSRLSTIAGSAHSIVYTFVP